MSEPRPTIGDVFSAAGQCEHGSLIPHVGSEGAHCHGPEWDTAGLQKDFKVLGFSAGYVVVTRRFDGVEGSLEFTHQPRVYFNFEPHQG